MTTWVIRAGEDGRQEKFALDENFAVIGWRKLRCAISTNAEELKAAIQRAYPDEPGGWPSDFRQTWDFANSAQKGDLVILPLKLRNGKRIQSRVAQNGLVAVGEIVGAYEYRPDEGETALHRRQVRWLSRGAPRINLPDDIERCIRYRMTVFPVKCRDVESRIRTFAESSPVEEA